MEKQRVYRPLLFLLCWLPLWGVSASAVDADGVLRLEIGLTEEKKRVMIHIYEQMLIC
ncbi:hypothetical protein Gste01_02512 [Geobacillus stearothermophilus ATCC 7953]